MARAGLGMTAEALAERAKVSKVTLSDFEIGKRSPHPRTLEAIKTALESAGVEFTNGNAPGVKLHKAGARAASIPIEDLNAENCE
ncbi:MAG: helix-turn-helix domain-containing protein [Roseiarcus sp.]|jgi:transcriptional regulator with XRE-family HTH domain